MREEMSYEGREVISEMRKKGIREERLSHSGK
jgi:hypothetical protein